MEEILLQETNKSVSDGGEGDATYEAEEVGLAKKGVLKGWHKGAHPHHNTIKPQKCQWKIRGLAKQYKPHNHMRPKENWCLQ